MIRPGREPRLATPLPNWQVPYAVTFEWYEVPGASAYAIQVSTEPTFTTGVVVNEAVPGCVFQVEVPFAGTLWWRVSAYDARGLPGPWSAVRKLEILAPPLAASVAGITLSPTGVAGGEPSAGLVTLDSPAPEGGASVYLASSRADLVAMPSRLIIPAGAVGAAFAIGTRQVQRSADVGIFVGSKGPMRTAVLTVGLPRPPARLLSLGVHPALLAAGGQAQGTVALAGPATSTTVVALASSDTSRAVVPDLVQVPAGASSASFDVRTAHNNTPGAVEIRASVGAVVKSVTLKLGGAASMYMMRSPEQGAPEEDTILPRDRAIEFRWFGVGGAATYTFELDYSPLFASSFSMRRVLLAPSVSVGPLLPGTAWWRVRANDEYGAPGLWSPARRLHIR